MWHSASCIFLLKVGYDLQMEAQQQSAGAETKALEEELTKARSEANALRSQGEQTGGAMQARDKVPYHPFQVPV